MQNWNHAMRQISSESKYCKVVHADDWIFPECLEKMVGIAENYPSVGIVGAYRLDEDTVNLDGLSYPSTVVSGRDLCRRSLLGGPYVFGSPTSILIRSDLIMRRQSFYNEDNIHADKEICYELLQNSDFGFVHQVLTFTRRHNEAETTFSRKYNTYRVAKLLIMKKYGPVFLKPGEYNHMFNNMVKSYYTYLAKSVFDLKSKDFFKFHKIGLKKIGVPVKPAKLLIAILKELMNFLDTMRSVKSALKRRALNYRKH
jgi:glycosyltransferase involved in cell wall biosynthesis